MKKDSERQRDLTPQEGEAFLNTFDAALQGGAPQGPHAGLAEFGAAARRGLLQLDERGDRPAASAELRNSIARELAVAPRLARTRAWMRRWRIGVLDIAALLAIGALSVALYRTNLELAHPRPSDKTGNAHSALADGDAENKKTDPADEATEAEEPWLKELRTKLAEKVRIEFHEQSLAGVMAWFNQQLKTNVIIDPKLAAKGADKAVITMNVTDMDAGNALHWVCAQADVGYDIRNHAIFITEKGGIVSDVKLKVYDVSRTGLSAKEFAVLIHDALYPAEFADPETSICSYNEKLVVMQRREMHAEILNFIALLKRSESETEVVRAGPGVPEWQKAIEAKLEKKVSFNYIDKPFVDALDDLRKQIDVTIFVDPRAAASNPNINPNINLRVAEMPAKEALDWLLRLSNLKRSLRNEAIFISTPDRDQPINELRIYNVSDLTAGAGKEDAAALAELLRSRIRPDRWDAALGTTVIQTSGRLFVLQQPEIHALIHDFLAKLRGK